MIKIKRFFIYFAQNREGELCGIRCQPKQSKELIFPVLQSTALAL